MSGFRPSNLWSVLLPEFYVKGHQDRQGDDDQDGCRGFYPEHLLVQLEGFGVDAGAAQADPHHNDDGEEEGEAHADEEGDLIDGGRGSVDDLRGGVSGVDPGVVAEGFGRVDIEEDAEYEAGDEACDGGCAGGPFPEHAQEEHGEDAGADEAGVFLDIGEAAAAADAEEILPGEDDADQHGEADGDAACPDEFLFVGFLVEIFFIDIEGEDGGDAVDLAGEGGDNGGGEGCDGESFEACWEEAQDGGVGVVLAAAFEVEVTVFIEHEGRDAGEHDDDRHE